MGEGEEGFEVAEEVEEVVGALLGALRDKDTVVRWSGAKGVGRLAACLPRELGEEVVDGVMELFGPTGAPRSESGVAEAGRWRDLATVRACG
jgi:hypothetical protein